mmetsp:Transcript_19447/g.36774  ORF Transcript_19447/g.36774 Transcript_19447/m.36774 type:complete len:111 (+) Transcript_19447:686-1018(+)
MGGSELCPLKGFYEGSNLMKPGWKGVIWSVEQLIEVVKYHYPGDFQDFSFVDSGMTPSEVLNEARSLRLAAMHKGKKKPSSPIKKESLTRPRTPNKLILFAETRRETQAV